jgi:hypothetical protein
MATRSLAILAGLVLASITYTADADVRAGSGSPAQAGAAATSTGVDLSSQRRVRPLRAPTRIRVTPLYRYPGPNAVRQCTSWLAQEWRPSGTVIVPRMQCWWEPG